MIIIRYQSRISVISIALFLKIILVYFKLYQIYLYFRLCKMKSAKRKTFAEISQLSDNLQKVAKNC